MTRFAFVTRPVCRSVLNLGPVEMFFNHFSQEEPGCPK